LGLRRAFRHRLHPDGRGPARGHACLDRIYIPGAGWHGFDPTNNKLAGSEHISVAVARDQDKACPLSGSWAGDANAFERMEVSVQVVHVAA
jgi:transglutaminase-like putative cysteine protease